ncbi:hypothetical protein EW026_g9 [Hermanssonia centrifuga]|uniref:Uncharacterized protein n=1 Tax=Hermanssonia centrifuga TaxID=98765 RepID=A0A4S4KVS2_9APHY|nr:hypothetical protein EW026_g9 [Hermanssonia centrifuga]
MTRFTSILLLAAVIPFALATNGSTKSDCKENEFFFEQKECCLPHGGPPSPPPSPPKGVTCPVSGWYWHTGKQCCVPHQPPAPSTPAPQCDKTCFWSSLDLKCYPGSSSSPPTSTTPVSQPSAKPGNSNNNNNNHHKRNMKSRSASLCPNSMEACPLKGLTATSNDYECLDTDAELSLAVVAHPSALARTALPLRAFGMSHALRVAVLQGYKLASDRKSCTKL